MKMSKKLDQEIMTVENLAKLIKNISETVKLGTEDEICHRKNLTLRQKSKFWGNIEILGKHRNFGQKSKF